MAVPLISVRNKRTGAKALLPETALRVFPDFVRTARQERTDADAAPAKATTPRRRRSTTKKAASAAQNKE